MSRTIEQAATECRAAWAKHPDAEYGWCVHHETEMEKLTEPVENRIQYILAQKEEDEQIVRLDNLRPVLSIPVILAGKAYDEAVAPAQKAYAEAVASAGKAYDEAVAPAQKAYDEALAPAWKAYDEATGSAQKAYNKATAPARKAYNEALAPAHKQDVPNHTWNGQSIFAKE